MRQYELMTIFPSSTEIVQAGKATLIEQLTQHGAVDFKETDLGDRNLAYPIRKNQRGHYFLFVVSLNEQKLIALTQAFKLMPHLLKYLFVRIETKPVEQAV